MKPEPTSKLSKLDTSQLNQSNLKLQSKFGIADIEKEVANPLYFSDEVSKQQHAADAFKVH